MSLIEKGTVSVGVKMRSDMVDEIEARAASMHMSASTYCRMVLMELLTSDEAVPLDVGHG